MTTKIEQKEERPIVVRRPFALRFLAQLYLFLSTFLCLVQGANAQHYLQTNLVSDVPGLAAPPVDSNLVNSWGIAHSATSPWWVADNGTGVSTLYNGAGQHISLVVTIPGNGGTATPTGIVFNGSADFEVASGKPALFIFVTEDGTISGWNPGANPLNAIQKFPTSGTSGGVIKARRLPLMALRTISMLPTSMVGLSMSLTGPSARSNYPWVLLQTRNFQQDMPPSMYRTSMRKFSLLSRSMRM